MSKARKQNVPTPAQTRAVGRLCRRGHQLSEAADLSGIDPEQAQRWVAEGSEPDAGKAVAGFARAVVVGRLEAQRDVCEVLLHVSRDGQDKASRWVRKWAKADPDRLALLLRLVDDLGLKGA